MKTWFWLLLAIFTLMVGCAPGNSANKQSYPADAPAYGETGMWHQNPETGAEQQMRIWREESGR